MQANALKNPVVTRTQIEQLETMREAMDSMKKRFELLENAVKATEQELISAIEAGASVPYGIDLQIRTSERRYPHWKSEYAIVAAQVPAAKTVEQVLAMTTPTVFKTLLVK